MPGHQRRYFVQSGATRLLTAIGLASCLLTLSCGRNEGASGPTSVAPAAPSSSVADDALRLLIFGDQGTGEEGQFKVGSAMRSYCARTGCEAGVVLGDNFYPNGVHSIDDEQFITKFEKPYEGLEFPFYAVLGNHDHHAGKASINAQIGYSAVSSRWRMPSSYYRFTLANADFFALDTERLLRDDEQLSWLEAEIDASDARWKIVLGHHPIYSVGHHGYFDWTELGEQARLRARLSPILCRSHAVYLSGHEHLLQLNQLPCGAVAIVSGAAAKPKRSWQHMVDRQREHLRFHAADQLGFAHATIRDDSIRFDFVDDEAQTIFSFDFE